MHGGFQTGINPARAHPARIILQYDQEIPVLDPGMDGRRTNHPPVAQECNPAADRLFGRAGETSGSLVVQLPGNPIP